MTIVARPPLISLKNILFATDLTTKPVSDATCNTCDEYHRRVALKNSMITAQCDPVILHCKAATDETAYFFGNDMLSRCVASPCFGFRTKGVFSPSRKSSAEYYFLQEFALT
jgi:hypothetical protein